MCKAEQNGLIIQFEGILELFLLHIALLGFCHPLEVVSKHSFKSWPVCQEQQCFVDCCLGVLNHNQRMLFVPSKVEQFKVLLSVLRQLHRLQAFIKHHSCCICIHCTKALLRVKQLDQTLDHKSDPALIHHTAVWTEELPVLGVCQLLGACAVMQARVRPHSAGCSLPQGLLCLAAWCLQCQAHTVSASPCAFCHPQSQALTRRLWTHGRAVKPLLALA